jgi:hypothetical protein
MATNEVLVNLFQKHFEAEQKQEELLNKMEREELEDLGELEIVASEISTLNRHIEVVQQELARLHEQEVKKADEAAAREEQALKFEETIHEQVATKTEGRKEEYRFIASLYDTTKCSKWLVMVMRRMESLDTIDVSMEGSDFETREWVSTEKRNWRLWGEALSARLEEL